MRTGAVASFVLELRWRDVPDDVRRRLAWLLLDLDAVARAGRVAPAARIAADYATAAHAGDTASALLDGRPLSLPGAAWANGVLANALDFDDGHRLAKGHPGAIVIPAALAAAEARDAPLEELLTAVAIGYEIAIRAGIELHRRDAQYHASGAWGALGAAAAVSRLLGLEARRLEHAIGLAEHHAPLAPVMRSVAQPTMVKDATGWGAFVGASSAMLAELDFTAVPSLLLGDAPDLLGECWRIREVYVKAHPCCRWSQPALAAALALRRRHALEAADIASVAVRTFAAADGLARSAPATTEEAQYNLVWPVATALVRGSFGVEDVLDRLEDERAAALAERTRIVVDPALTRAFPARRRAVVSVELRSGSRLDSEAAEAPGEPDDPDWEAVVAAKARAHLGPLTESPTVEELIDLFALGRGRRCPSST